MTGDYNNTIELSLTHCLFKRGKKEKEKKAFIVIKNLLIKSLKVGFVILCFFFVFKEFHIIFFFFSVLLYRMVPRLTIKYD